MEDRPGDICNFQGPLDKRSEKKNQGNRWKEILEEEKQKDKSKEKEEEE